MTKPFIHFWVIRYGYKCCWCCGVVLTAVPGKRASGCRGVVHISTR
jgi:hypothetical protein